MFRRLRELGFEVQRKAGRLNDPGEPTAAIVIVHTDPSPGGSIDENLVGERFRFPAEFSALVKPGRHFVYFHAAKALLGRIGRTPVYFGTGTIGEVWEDPRNESDTSEHGRYWFASLDDYRPFESPIAWDENGDRFENIPLDRFGVAVRALSKDTFQAILSAREMVAGEALLGVPRCLVTPLNEQTLLVAEDDLLSISPEGGRGGRMVVQRSGRSRRAKALGDRGERLVFNRLAEIATSEGWTDLRWVASEGETPGWDIEYRGSNGKIVAVEVKATVAFGFSSIIVTQNEWEAARLMRDRYRLALVAGVDTRTPKIDWIDDPWGLESAGSLMVQPSAFTLRKCGGDAQRE